MNNPNPYHPPPEFVEDQSEEEASKLALNLDRAIPYSGQLTTDDIIVWFPLGSWQFASQIIVRVAVTLSALAVATWFVIHNAVDGFRIYPILYFVAGLIALNPFRSGMALLKPMLSLGEIKRHLADSKFTRGYFDSHGGCWQTEDHVIQFAWSEVQYAYTIETGVCFSIDGQQNYYLPKRFFRSSEEFYLLSVALFERTYPGHEVTIKQSDFQSDEFLADNCMTKDEIESARGWGMGHWPIADTPEKRIAIDYEVDRRKDWTKSERKEWIRRCVVFFLTFNIPVHLSLFIWLAVDRYQSGSWVFVRADWQSWLFLVFFGLYQFRAVREMLVYYRNGLAISPFRMVFSDLGCLTIESENYLRWMTYRPEIRLQIDDKSVGWTMDEEPDQRLRLRRAAIGEEKSRQLETLLRESMNRLHDSQSSRSG